LQAQGQLHQARTTLEEALVEASKAGARGLGYIAWVEAGLANLLYEQNELEDALSLLAGAAARIQKWPNHHHKIYIDTLQARVLLAQGDLEGARTAIGEADQIRRSAPLSRWLRRITEAELVRVWLALQAAGVRLSPGDPVAEQSSAIIDSWQRELSGVDESEKIWSDECVQIAALTLSRVLLAAGQAEEVLSLLEPVTRNTQAAGHVGAAIESHVLSAVATQGKLGGKTAPALELLEKALCLAKPGGYVRVFLDEGQPLQLLLAQWLAHSHPGSLRDYAIYLLNQFDVEQHWITGKQGKDSPAAGTSSGFGQVLVEPVSQRELEVLQLMALGRTNQEIAQQLIVAPGTVKAHAASIYRKLDVANRTEAVARARQLGILP
jgi:LuxR family maltose regulon positive regulatory protein